VIAETGHFALVLAFAVALLQTVLPQIGAYRQDARLMAVGVPAAQAQFLLVALSFAALTAAFVTSDFSVYAVAQHSHSAKPLLYKITGVWGNHEGSMLLWILILSVFGAAVATFGRDLPDSLRARVLSVQALIGVAFLAFLLFTSNPFTRLDPAPIDGGGLNPLLQDPALAFHPPFLYMGYVGFSMAFSFAVAALLEGKVDPGWARWVRPWTLAAWMALTLGIAMGSWWAYYELGWGGWWFWDPVENASLMPWLVGTALLHSAIVVEKRGALKSWTILLAIFAFSLSLIGTFLVRSGVLTSVHAFATDPERGLVILGILAFFIGGALTLYAWRAPQLKGGGLFAPVSRESALVLNNLFLAAATVAVFVGTLYPLGLDALTGEKISVGPPFFNMTFVPIVLPLLLLVPLGPLLAWKRSDIYPVLQRLFAAAGLAILTIIAVAAFNSEGPWLAPIGLGLAAWLVFGAFSDIAYRVKAFKAPARESLRRMRHLPRAVWGSTLAHAGVGIMVAGIVGISAWRVESVAAMATGDVLEVGGYELMLANVGAYEGPNFRAEKAEFIAVKNGREIARLRPEKRVYPVQNMPTTEAAIYTAWISDLYVVLGDRRGENEWTVRAYVNPLVPWIWIGSVIMVLGGAVSLSDRRYRLGIPFARRKARVAAEGAAS
jgi:cytochrome c-type biogenesis protein CcmF